MGFVRTWRATTIFPKTVFARSILSALLIPAKIVAGLLASGWAALILRTGLFAARRGCCVWSFSGRLTGSSLKGPGLRCGRSFFDRFRLDQFGDRDFLEVVFRGFGVREEMHPCGGARAGTGIADLLSGEPDHLVALGTFPGSSDIVSGAQAGAFDGKTPVYQ